MRARVLLACLLVALGCGRARPTVQPEPGSPFAQVQPGMGQTQVQAILGPPTDRGPIHATGKVFAPFYFGDDAIEGAWTSRGACSGRSRSWTSRSTRTRPGTTGAEPCSPRS